MSSDGDEQAVILSRGIASSLLLNSEVVFQGAAEEDVIPGSNGQSRHTNLGIMVFNRPGTPVLVEVRMREPVEIIRSKLRSQPPWLERGAQIEKLIVG